MKCIGKSVSVEFCPICRTSSTMNVTIKIELLLTKDLSIPEGRLAVRF